MSTKKKEPVFIDKRSVYVAPDVVFGENVIIYPNNFIESGTVIGNNVTLLPGNYIEESTIGSGSKIQSSTIENSTIGERVIIGPNAHLRPQSKIGNNVRIGNFCEIKNSKIGEGTKISHLSYVGDADVGKNCNIGCGAIFVNYNGVTKAIIVTNQKLQTSAKIIQIDSNLAENLNSIVAIYPLQELACTIADYRGCNPDRPRNLAKSVTVE